MVYAPDAQNSWLVVDLATPGDPILRVTHAYHHRVLHFKYSYCPKAFISWVLPPRLSPLGFRFRVFKIHSVFLFQGVVIFREQVTSVVCSSRATPLAQPLGLPQKGHDLSVCPSLLSTERSCCVVSVTVWAIHTAISILMNYKPNMWFSLWRQYGYRAAICQWSYDLSLLPSISVHMNRLISQPSYKAKITFVCFAGYTFKSC
jgi:hypothetical protein